MKEIANWLQRISSTRLMAITALVMIGFSLLFLPGQTESSKLYSGGAGIPDLLFSYTPQQIYQMAADYGANGRQAYIQARWTFDLIFPLVYVSFLAVGISWYLNRLPGWVDTCKLASLLPILAGVFDFLENIGTSLTMAIYPQRLPALLVLASLSTPLKWILVGLSTACYLVLGTAALVAGIKNRAK